MLREQIREHQHLLIASIVLFLLALTRLILGYFFLLVSSMIAFPIFVSPSGIYKNKY
ncbi:hypothetical protein I4U23_022453 [Adineta vaga]|nr:hypothetical protein I4U23_022453 [Adineta vaga]